MAKRNPQDLTESQKAFCREYIYDWNGTRAYLAAYPNSSYEAAMSSASELLRNPKIEAYLTEIQEDLEKMAGISRLKVLQEHQKLAFSSIAHLHNTWVTRKEFESLTDDQKSAIEEISTQIKTSRNTDGTLEENEYVKIKLYSKQKSLDAINRMLGYDAAQKVEVKGTVKSYNIVPASQRKGNSGK